MSAANAKKKKTSQPALATTGRGAAFAITLGITLITLSLAWLLSFFSGSDSYVLLEMRKALQGLCGPLCPVFPVLLLWGGVKLMVSSRHRVAVRDIALVSCLYLLLLTGYTLIARVQQNTEVLSYMDFVGKQNYKTMVTGYDGFSAYLYQAYSLRTSGAGGLIGMLLAYPLWKMLGMLIGVLTVAALMILCLFLLLRLNPGDIFRSASEKGEKNRIRREQKRREKEAAQQEEDARQAEIARQEQEKIYQHWPMEELQPGQRVAMEEGAPPPPAYYQPAPIYAAAPAPQPRQPMTGGETGFYPVSHDLYDERFPLHDAPREEGANPAVYPPMPPEEESLYPDAGHDAPAAPSFHPADGPSAGEDSFAPEAEEEEVPTGRTNAPVPHAPAAPAPLEEEEDLPPWEGPDLPNGAEEEETPPIPAYAHPFPEKREKQPAPAPEKPALVTEKPVSRPAPASDWASQVRRREEEISDEMPEHTTRRGEPKPVYTDPVMPITGEHIAISPRRDNEKTGANTRLDGTASPAVQQSTMGMFMPYQAPPIRLLNESRHIPQADAAQEDERRAQIIEGTLRSFGVEAEVKQIMHGPSITRFAIQIAPGVKVSRVTGIADNLALELKTKHVRVEAPIQGTSYIGIEVPNTLVSTVSLREVLDSPEMKNHPSPLMVALGKDIAGAPILCDLSKMPHLLIAGATGSGKSVCINSIVCSLLYRTSPDQVRLIMIDPKQVELSVYNGIPHLLVPVVSDPRKASGALAWVVQEMLERYGKFSAQGVRNLAGYNKANQGTDQVLPNIVVIIDEMADLMEVCRKDVEESIRRLAALARAAGIYMVLATQRPSVDVITGVIKNNIPSRIAFAVSSGTDSRTIIDINGAEKLMGKGDMLYKPAGTSPLRVQGCLVTDDEVNAIAEYISSRYQTDYDPNIIEHLDAANKEKEADEVDVPAEDAGGERDFDSYLQQAIEMAVEDGQSSTSMLQRRLRVGYARAGRLIDEMEKRGIISHSEGSKPRKTLVTREQYYEMLRDEE